MLYEGLLFVQPHGKGTVVRIAAHAPGAVFGRTDFLSPNTHRELFSVPDIALYASAPNHVFGL